MKIGILYPRSNVYPGMMLDFMDGIRSSLKYLQLPDDIKLISESIGFGGNEKEVFEKAEKLLVLEGTDILVAYVDLKVVEILKPLLLSSGKLVLLVNPGANFPQHWIASPNVLNLTLQHGFLCWLSGKLASQKYANAVLATSLYDCGYLHTAAFVKGFERSGGKITFNYINNQRYDDGFDIMQLTDFLSLDHETNTLLCVFDALPASLFYSKLNRYAESARLELFVSPMMQENNPLTESGEGYSFPVNGYVPWHPSLSNNANLEFMKTYQQEAKRNASIFSLLGWETGLILKKIFLSVDNQNQNGAEIVSGLIGLAIEGPRGEIILDPKTNYFTTPVYKCFINSNSVDEELECIKNIQKEWIEFIGETYEGLSSGWTNTYLCY